MARIGEGNSRIAGAAEEQAVLAEAVAGELHAIADTSAATAQGAAQTAERSDRLLALARGLEETVRRYRA